MNKKEILEKLDSLKNSRNEDYIDEIEYHCNSDDITIEKLEDLAHEMANSMTSIYTSDLFKWLADDVSNLYIVNNAVAEFGMDTEDKDFDITNVIQLGQYKYHYDNIINIIRDLED